MERSSVLCLRTERTRRRRSPRSVRMRAFPRTPVVVQTPEGRRRTTTKAKTPTHYRVHHPHQHHRRRRYRSQTPVEAPKHHEPNLCHHVARALVPTPTPTPTPPRVHIARRARRTPVRSSPTRASRPRPTRGCVSDVVRRGSVRVRLETVAKFTRGKLLRHSSTPTRATVGRVKNLPDGRERCVDDASWSRGWSRARTRRDRGC